MRIGTIAKRLAACVRAVDTSRPVTGALAGVVMSNETEYPDAVDVVGYNYTENRYDQDHATYPDRIIYGSETGSGLDAWYAVRDKDFIFGQFIWTGTDYLGESGRWPSRGLYTGLLDFGSFPSHADISGLRCGARIRSRMQEHIRYMSIPSIPSMYSFRLMHGTSGTMTRGRTYVWCVIPMLRRRVCCSTAGW